MNLRMTLPRANFSSLALLLMLMLAAALGACSKDTPCVVCYEDEWSREPFPGQAKQHIKPLTPEDLKASGGVAPRPAAQ
ncbi:MAG: hypothetical protein EOP36_20315 [Rubrivivax sp.]|nr:MAG: hypothetical protein EOP36_20315 [Rubrivivax sp.]